MKFSISFPHEVTSNLRTGKVEKKIRKVIIECGSKYHEWAHIWLAPGKQIDLHTHPNGLVEDYRSSSPYVVFIGDNPGQYHKHCGVGKRHGAINNGDTPATIFAHKYRP